MADASAKRQESFICSVCLDLLKDPVTTACGHNYCLGCIKGCWDQEDDKGIYSCPQCRQTFKPRPALSKNTLIAEMVEELRKTGPSAAPDHCYAGPGDVECDVCTGRKLKAVKSCLECLVSYCETHYKVHNDVHPGKKHSVIDATGQLQERICSHHKRVLEIFCHTDQSCICCLCATDEHKDHEIVTAVEEWGNKQKHLKQTQLKYHQRIQEREKELQGLRKTVETLKSSVQTAVKDSERTFTEMIRSIERRRAEVIELIRAQEKAEVSRAEGVLNQLEQEIAELKRRDAELEQLSHTEDYIHFLKRFQSIRGSPRSKDLQNITFNQTFSFEAVKKSVSALKMQLEEKLNVIFKQEIANISAAVTHILIIQSLEYTDPELPVRRTNSKEMLPPYISVSDVQAVFSEPVSREEFLQYSCYFTLDPNTAERHLHLSEGNRRVECRPHLQSYPDHPERFHEWLQVLCREGVFGRCYWEVEWSGNGVYTAVSYKSISREGEGDKCVFGWNDQSWSLFLRGSSSSFWHKNKQTKLPLVASSRIGIYVDHRAGTLAFYSISDTMTLLYKVQTTFTHALYPGFWLTHTGSSVKLL